MKTDIFYSESFIGTPEITYVDGVGVRIEENTTRGFEVGVGPTNPFQSISHYASGNLSVDDVLAQDVRGLIEE